MRGAAKRKELSAAASLLMGKKVQVNGYYTGTVVEFTGVYLVMKNVTSPNGYTWSEKWVATEQVSSIKQIQ